MEAPKKPELYESDGSGGWRIHADQYSPNETQEWVTQEVSRCQHDMEYFGTRYCYTIHSYTTDPEAPPPTINLVPSYDSPSLSGRPWVFIRALFSALNPRRDVVIHKSRDMMASWIAMLACLHDLVFQKDWADMTLSLKEEEVDDGGENSTPSCLLGKVRFIYEHLPAFLRNLSPLTFSSMKVLNNQRNNVIRGYCGTATAGRGPKWQRAVLDEFAFVNNSSATFASVSSACATGKVLISTSHGKANNFFLIKDQRSYRVFPPSPPPVGRRKHWDLYELHWTLHPDKDEAWYERKSAEMTEEARARELDMDDTMSLGRRVYPKFDSAKHVAGGSRCPVDSVPYSPNRPLGIAADFNHDPLIWEIVQLYPTPPKFRVIGEICRRDASVDDAILEFVCRFGSAAYVQALLNQHPEWENIYARQMLQAGPEGHRAPVQLFGDATGESHTVHSIETLWKRVRQGLRAHKFDVANRVPKSNPPIPTRLETMNHALANGLVVVSSECVQLIKDCEEGVYDKAQHDMNQNKEDDDGSHLTRSHASSGLGYMLCILHKIATTGDAISRTRPRLSVRDMLGLDHMKGWVHGG